jgi:PAS domain-containing protein
MAAMHPFANLDGDHLRPRLAGSVARSAPVPPLLRRLEPLAAVFLGLHGVTVLAALGGRPWQLAVVGLVLLLGLVSLGGRGPTWMVPLRAGAILSAGVALQASTGGAAGWFAAWPFVLVAVYPLALPGPAGVVVAGLAVLGYVLVVRLAEPPVGPALAVARGALLAGLAGLAWVAASAYARMANLAVEAELELGRHERLARALLEALTDPTAVLDAHGRIVAANQGWVRFAAKDLTGLALAEVGQSYPAACEAAATAGYEGLQPAAKGVSAVLSGEVPRFRCRYHAPGGAGPFEVTVTPFADGDGAVVTHRSPPALPLR